MQDGQLRQGTAPAWSVVVQDEAATQRLAALLGRLVVPGAVIVLEGQLGAGKTTFVKGLAQSLGVDEAEVTSPTFALMHEYEGQVPVYHFDVYRLDDPAEFAELGADEYLAGRGVAVIEWGGRVREELPEERLEIVIQREDELAGRADAAAGGDASPTATARRLSFWPHGQAPREWVDKLAAAWREEGDGHAGAGA